MLNELRVQYARRHQFRTKGISVDGPSVTVSGKAEFGGARIGDGNSVGFDFNQGITQVIDNVSLIRGKHALQDRRRRAVDRATTASGESCSFTTSPTIADYLAAKSGANPFGLLEFSAAVRQISTREIQLRVLWLLRAGRLAGHASS